MPKDAGSISSALIVFLSPIQSIIIDPQYQANQWLRQNSVDPDSGAQDLLVLNSHDPNFLQLLAGSMKFGKKVLIENVGEAISKTLRPLFNKTMLRRDGVYQSISINGVVVPIEPNFKLHITTEIKNPKFPPEIAVFANFINFALTQESLEAQLLSVIVSEKQPKIEKTFAQLQVRTFECIEKMQDIENVILASLQNEVSVLLGSDDLIERFLRSNSQSRRVQRALEQAK